jgi:hypothetical protein
MIEVNAFALCRIRLPVMLNLPHHISEYADKGWAQRGGEIFLEFSVGIDHGVNAFDLCPYKTSLNVDLLHHMSE